MKRITVGVVAIYLVMCASLFAQNPRAIKSKMAGRAEAVPILLAPPNGSDVTDFFPLFQWKPVDVPPGVRLNYTLLIVERLPNQSLKDAIDNNNPFHEGSVEVLGFYKYPTTGNAFQKDKEYAFQVTSNVVIGDYPSAEDAKSDIWSFKFRADKKGPQLLAPPNESDVTDFFPVFQWRPIDVPPGVKLNYTLLIAERLPGQSFSDAITHNNPFHEGAVEGLGIYKYPSSGNAFESGKQYVFQVTSNAVIGNYPSAEDAKSEIWTFRFKANKPGPGLITPLNGSDVSDFFPTFQWKPIDVPPGIRLNYTLTIAERHPGQTLQDAIANNNPFHEGMVEVLGIYKYPASGNAFEKDKEYAFQVTSNVVVGNYPSAEDAKSEIWSFRFRANKPGPGLIAPLSGSDVSDFFPTFQWKPIDVPPGITLNYTLTIAERQPGQTLQDAIANNNPFHEGMVEALGIYKYPTSGNAFEKDKEYAFQVTSNVVQGNYPVAEDAKSEIWSFRFRAQKPGPKLLAPINGSIINDFHPLFQWQPITVPPGIVLDYTVVIVERHPGQSLQDAIANNNWFHEGLVVATGIYKYPPSGYAFEKGKEYAFQVTSNVEQGNYPSADDAKSEIWSFRFGLDKKGPVILFPVNGFELADPHPMFQWRAPETAPGVRLSYSLVVAEKRPNQSTQDAIDNNPIHEAEIVNALFYKYPATANRLERGKQYLLRITTHVTVGSYPAVEDAPSEIVSFFMGAPSIVYDPPHLLSPLNSSSVTNPYPIFQWNVINAPFEISIEYDLLIVERLAGQTPLRALRSNPVFHHATVQNAGRYVYPVDGLPFETGKEYIFQVAAGSENSAVKLANKGQSEIWSFTYNGASGSSTNLPFESLTLVENVAELVNLNAVVLTDELSSLRLNGFAGLRFLDPGASPAVIPVNLENLTLKKGDYAFPQFTAGRVTGTLRPGDLPVSLTGKNLVGGTLEFLSPSSLTITGLLRLFDGGKLYPLEGKLKLTSTGLSGDLKSKGSLTAPLLTLGTGDVKFKLTEAAVHFSEPVITLSGAFELYGNQSSCLLNNLTLASDGTISGTVDCSVPLSIALVPQSDKLMLKVTRVSGDFSSKLQANTLTYDLQIFGSLDFKADDKNYFGADVVLGVKPEGMSVRSFSPRGDINLSSIDLGWMKLGLSRLSLSSLSFSGGKWDFAFATDMNFSFPAFDNLKLPTITGVTFAPGGFKIPDINFPQLKLPKVDFSGYELSFESVKLRSFTFPWLQWKSGSLTGFNFDLGLNLKMPNLPSLTAPELRGLNIQIPKASLGDLGFNATLPSFKFNPPGIKLPLFNGMSFDIFELSGSLGANFKGSLFDLLPNIRIKGKLPLPSLFACAESDRYLDLLSNGIQMDGTGGLKGKVENIVPKCPLVLGPVTLTMKESSVDFLVTQKKQSIVIDGIAELLFKSQGGKSVATSVQVTYDIIQGKLITLKGSLDTPFVWDVPTIDPVFSFGLDKATIDLETLFIDGRQTLRLDSGKTLGCTFNKLALKWSDFSVSSGEVIFDNAFALKAAINGNSLTYRAVQRDSILTEATGLLLQLPQTLTLSRSGLAVKGSGRAHLKIAGKDLANIEARCSDDCAFQLSPFKLSTGQIEFLYSGTRVAVLTHQGFFPDVLTLVSKALPDTLPLPVSSIAFAIIKSGGQELVSRSTVSTGLRLQTKPGQSIRLVIPALQYNKGKAPEIDVALDIVIHPVTFALVSGTIEATIPQTKAADFDLSQDGIPFSIQKLTYTKDAGLAVYKLDGQLNVFGKSVNGSNAVQLTLLPDGRLSGTMNFSTTENIPISTGSDRIGLVINQVNGSIASQAIPKQIAFDLNLASTIRLKLSDTRTYGASSMVHFTQNGFELKDFKPDSASASAVLDLKWIQLALSDLKIPKLSYQRTVGWDYEFGVSIQFAFPDLALRIPKVAGIVIDKQGIHFPAISIPEMSDSAHSYMGFGLKPLAFRMAPFVYNWYTGAASSSGSWGFAFDFELSFPQFPGGAAGALRTPKVSILNAGYTDGKITAKIEVKDFASPGLLLPLGGDVGMFVRNISGDLTVNGGVQSFNVLFKGNLQLPKSFQCGTDNGQFDMFATALSVTAGGGISGTVSNFVPGCPLDMGIGKFQITTSTLNFAFTNSVQSAILDLSGTLKIPGQTSPDTISAAGSIKYDLVRNAMVDGSIAINQPFTWRVPSKDPVLTFVVRGAVLNKDGLLINGQSDLQLAGGGSVGVQMNNLLMDIKSFAVKSGDATFLNQLALKLLVDNGNLSWSAVSPTSILTERYGALLTLPAALKLDASGLAVTGQANVSFRWNDTTWSNIVSKYSRDFSIRLSPFKVKTGKAELFKDSTLIARLDSTGLQPGNILGVVPLPDRIPLPDEKIAYLQIKQNGIAMVETQPVSGGMQLRTKPGQTVQLTLPALQYGKPAPPTVDVALDVTVNTSTYQVVSGSIKVSGDSLIALRDAGVPIVLTSLAYDRGQGGSYEISVSGIVDLPKVLNDLKIRVDNLTLSTSGLAGTVSTGVFAPEHLANETYILQKQMGSLEVRVQGVTASFGTQKTGVSFSGDIVSDLFKDGVNPAPIHYAAVFDAVKKQFVFSLSFAHLQDGAIPISVARFKPAAVKNNPAAQVTIAADEFALALSGVLTAPKLSQTFSLTIGGLTVSSKTGVSVASISYTKGEEQQFNFFGANFVITSLTPSYTNKVLYLGMSGSLTFLNNQSTFQNLKVGTDGSISLDGADFFSKDIFIVPDFVALSRLGIRRDSLLVEGFVRLPQPADTTRQRFNILIAPDGKISGGSEIAILNAPEELAGRDFWIAKFHPTYAALSLDFADIKQSHFKVVADVYLNNDVNKRIQLGYKTGGVIFPGLDVSFAGVVTWGNFKSAVNDFEWESLKLEKLSIAAPASIPKFNLSISGLMSLAVPGVTGGIDFSDLKIDASGHTTLPIIKGGILSLADIVDLEIKEFSFSDSARVIKVNSGTAPSGSSAGSAKTEDVSITSYIRFGATIDVKGVAKGGVEEFLAYKTQTSTNLLIRNANFGIAGVAEFRVDMKYQSSANGFALLVGGTGTVVNGPGIIVVGKIGRMNNTTSMGLFVAAKGLAMPIPPPVPPAVPIGYLTEIGGGFFLNPDQADLDLVKQLAGFSGKDQQTSSKIGTDPGKFAVLLYGGAALLEPSGTLIKGKVLMTITENYFLLDGQVVLLSLDNLLEGSMHLGVSWKNSIKAEGSISVTLDVSALLYAKADLNFFIYGKDAWGIMGTVDAKVVLVFDMHGKLFIGSTGFVTSLSISQPIDLWIINLNAGIEVTMWYKANISWGAYAKTWIEVSVLGGTASAQGYLRLALLGSPNFYLYGVAGIKAQALGGTWEGSVWAKVSSNDIDGGFGSDPALERLLAEAVGTADEMNKAADAAQTAIQGARATPPAITTADLENAFSGLYSATIGIQSSNAAVKIVSLLLVASMERECDTYGVANAPPGERSEFDWVISNIYASKDAPSADERNRLDPTRNTLDGQIKNLNSDRAAIGARLAQTSSKVSAYAGQTDAAGDENPVSGLASFDPNGTTIPAMKIDSTKAMQNASLFKQSELSKDKAEERISAAIGSLETALQGVDNALKGASGQDGVQQFGNSYATLLETDGKFYADYVTYFDKERSFGIDKLNQINGRVASLTRAIEAKTDRLSPIGTIGVKTVKVNEFYSYQVADTVLSDNDKTLLAERKALGAWRYGQILMFEQEKDLQGQMNTWYSAWNHMNEGQRKAEVTAKGVQLWIGVAQAGLAALQTKATTIINNAAQGPYQKDEQNLTTSQATYTRGLDSLYQKKVRLAENLYDILDRYAVWKKDNDNGLTTKALRVSGQVRTIGTGGAKPVLLAKGLSLTDIDSKKAALRKELEVPRIASIQIAVKPEPAYVKGNFDWSATSSSSFMDYSIRTDAEAYQSVGDRTTLSRYFLQGSANSKIFYLRARSGAGYSNERTATFTVPIKGPPALGTPSAVSAPVITGMAIDNTSPSTPAVRFPGYQTVTSPLAGPGGTIPVSGSATTIEVEFNAYDPESGVVEYQYAVMLSIARVGVGPMASPKVTPWQSSGGRTAVTISGLALQHGKTCAVIVKARNGANLWSVVGTSTELLIDTTKPTAPQKLPDLRSPFSSMLLGAQAFNVISPIPLPAAVLSNAGGTGASGSQAGNPVPPKIMVNWGPADDPESGIMNYQYRVVPVSKPGQASSDWTTVGPSVLTATIEGGILTYADSFRVVVRATNNAGLSGPEATMSTFRPDDPTPPTAPYAPIAAGVQHLAGKTFLIVGTRSNDPETGLTGYQLAIGNTPGGTNVKAWSSTIDFKESDLGPGNSWMLPDLSLTPGKSYYVSLRGVNGRGVAGPQCVSGPFIFDLTPPVKPMLTPSVVKQLHGTTQLRLSFSNVSDPESGINRIEYCIGTSTGKSDALPWESAGTVSSTDVDVMKLSLKPKTQYYIGMRTFNNAGMQSLEFWTSVQVP